MALILLNWGALSRHFDLLDQELRKSESQLSESIRQFALKSNQYRDLLEDQVQSNSRRRKLRRQAQEIRRALKEQGVPEELILSRTMHSMTDRSPSTDSTTVTSDNAFRSRSSNLHKLSGSLGTITLDDYENIGPNSNLGINDRTTWFMADFSRDQAEELLRSKPVGTFLIRTSSEGRRLALSIRHKRVKSKTDPCGWMFPGLRTKYEPQLDISLQVKEVSRPT
ncbi:hypothetical protein P879_07807 [Paragonimus westermani]|uniref:SH2 domain-containing protein n=1 Tax=Paragonimus westermani TaxID=34504 RepID=A0A8T0D9E6_9TREM|nr:hypothetical protein P879_07807 [Paragonimus westermani]